MERELELDVLHKPYIFNTYVFLCVNAGKFTQVFWLIDFWRYHDNHFCKEH